MSILNILNKLAATASRNEKEAILKSEHNNQLLKAVFVAAYDPTINYFIKKVPVVRKHDGMTSLEGAMIRLKYLSSREFTGNAAIEHLTGILMSVTEEDAVVISRIIERDLKCGASDSTANKIWPGLIPEFPYMRCSLPKAAKLDKWDWKRGVFCQVKADGMFANVDNCGVGTVSITSRSGSQFDPDRFKNLVKSVLKHVPEGYRLNGEFLVERHGEVLPREVGNGILNSVLKGGEFEQGDEPTYLAWDLIPLSEAVPGGKFKMEYAKRFEVLLANISKAEHISVIQTKVVHSLEDAYKCYFELVAQGYEGAIIKNPSGVWFDGTSKEQVKLKVECEVDLEILGFNEGKGKNADTFGSIICGTSDRKLIVSVSGFTDNERMRLHKIRDKIVHKIMAVRFNNIMYPSTPDGVYSLFLPRHVEIREDKHKADSLAHVIEQFEALIKKGC